MHIEYPKKMYHKDGRRRLIETVGDQVQYEEGWGESPVGPFNEKIIESDSESEEDLEPEEEPDVELEGSITAAIQGRRGPGRPRRES